MAGNQADKDKQSRDLGWLLFTGSGPHSGLLLYYSYRQVKKRNKALYLPVTEGISNSRMW